MSILLRCCSALLLAGTIVWGFAGKASAQLALPGAVAPAPAGTVQSPEAAPRPRHRVVRTPGGAEETPKSLPVAVVPSPDALVGRTLSLNGDQSQITFQAKAKDLEVSKMTLAGESTDDARKTCTVEASGTPFAVKSIGRPDGVERIQVDFPACGLAFDVLDGAVLVDRTQGVCEFKDAKCRINPVGLWGPQSGDLGPDKVKGIERERAEAERLVRTDYQALVHSTKDRSAVMGYARDQAQFSSTRAELCRDYVGEGRHGFCSDKLTEARAAFLRAELASAIEQKLERKKNRAARNR